ncbi:translesion error-prone DNA polymerase V autoproteolytic subunit [Affinibrenneria salicis]|uniref:Translesion error-prone DNA polymerase V autoproteolytic subunit n=1 Tax=Affinibrenneria salicis TaxID=2590031 RepID=A0A5J5G3W1_9GAMM|nr:translesion error-prone DNA polymerase V autoproteolytic subunit [Affinibrenneria salicis]KAA9001700.1 translesion error-prone DNA polymerase V autoproteolytic subunit [Affinibrenneria salicis]
MHVIKLSELPFGPALPLFGDRIAAGFPSPAQDYVEQRINLNDVCVQHPAATYFVRVCGDSMVDASINDGDLVVVDSSLQARHGDIVIAAIGGDFTIKRLQTTPRPALLPMNARYAPIYLNPAEQLDIFGVVTYVIHALR